MDPKHVIMFVLLDVAIVIAAARLTGRLFRRIGQPAVVGEIVAGVALGPTLLGAFPGDLDEVLFPLAARPYLSVIAQLGLVLFMFVVGLELDVSLLRGRQRVAGAVAAGSVVLPLALGSLLALLLYPMHQEAGGAPVPQLGFVLFLGVAMSITALPVLARILIERRMQRTATGGLALACAAIVDVLGWALLAVVVAVAAGGSAGGAFGIMGLTVLFGLVMFLGVRPLLARLVRWHRAAGRLTPDMLAVVLAGLLLSAWVTELIGAHAIFGGFLFGAAMPRREAAALTRALLERLEQVGLLLLLPVFFVVVGLQVDVGAIGLAGVWQLALILLVAFAGKIVGTAAAAHTQELPRRQQLALGLLMNTRGLTVIVALQVGVQLGLLDTTMFTLMVIMVLATTLMTGPLLRRVYPDHDLQRELADAERDELGETGSFTVLAVMPEPAAAGAWRLAELARELTGREHPARVVLCRLLPAQVELEMASGLGAELGMIAAAGDELRVLARELEVSGTACSVVARVAADPAAAIAVLVEGMGVDIVLAPEGDVAALDPASDATLVLARLGDPGAARPPEGPAVAALVDTGAGGRAALRIGAQLALRTDSTLAICPLEGKLGEERGEAAIEAFRQRRVPARLAEPVVVAAAAVLVVPGDAEPPPATSDATTVLRVRPAATDLDESVAEVAVESS